MPRDYETCPYMLDFEAELALDDRLSHRCMRMPMRIFSDKLCVGCPIKLDCCGYYSQNARAAQTYRFCPICGKELNVAAGN